MKKIVFSFLLVFVVSVCLAQPPAGKASVGSSYGARIDPANSINAAELPAMLKTKDTVHVKVKAKVTEVCSKKGCWMNFVVNEKEQAFVKMKDYAFFVPVDMVGKTVVIEGNAYNKITSVSELQHYAEDAKKSRKEIDAITEPKTEIRFMADGILVVE